MLTISLVDSRASRIVWLLEELELNYEIKVYNRGPDYLSPPEIKKVYPLGVSPFIQIFQNGSTEPITIGESGNIIQYLIKHYDTKKKLTPDNEADQRAVDFYLHFTEGTLQPHIVSLLVGHFAVQQAPWGAKILVRTVINKINTLFYLKKVKTYLAFLDSEMGKNPGKYFAGDKLTGADIILDFPINENVFSSPERFKSLAGDFDPKREYPNLYAWHKLTMALPGRVKAVQSEADAKAKL